MGLVGASTMYFHHVVGPEYGNLVQCWYIIHNKHGLTSMIIKHQVKKSFSVFDKAWLPPVLDESQLSTQTWSYGWFLLAGHPEKIYCYLVEVCNSWVPTTTVIVSLGRDLFPDVFELVPVLPPSCYKSCAALSPPCQRNNDSTEHLAFTPSAVLWGRGYGFGSFFWNMFPDIRKPKFFLSHYKAGFKKAWGHYMH